jgi:hypothetical protein
MPFAQVHALFQLMTEKKMSYYRQFIRGYNFYKEGYVHNIMMNNNISTENPLYYVRSKCGGGRDKRIRIFNYLL